MTPRRPHLLGPIVAALVILLTAGGTALASDRIPVSSVDDTSVSIANRIGAVDNVVVAMDGRLDRILAALPAGHPPSPIFESLAATRSSFGTLISTIDARLCTQDGVIGSGDASLADGDVYASDTSSTGLVNQLASVRSVTTELNGRMIRILGALPPGPPVREVQDALLDVRFDATSGFDAITGRLGDSIHPPSPCVTT